MKTYLPSFLIVLAFSLTSCETVYYRTQNGVQGSSKASNTAKKLYASQEAEFKGLMEKDAEDRNQRAAAAVNLFLNETPAAAKAAILFKNNSSCDIIIRVNGDAKRLSVPVKANDMNYILVDKNTYSFSAKLCKAQYQSTKRISESIEIGISEYQ